MESILLVYTYWEQTLKFLHLNTKICVAKGGAAVLNYGSYFNIDKVVQQNLFLLIGSQSSWYQKNSNYADSFAVFNFHICQFIFIL